MSPINETLIDRAIELAIAEDLGLNGEGDLTSEATISDQCLASAVVVLKEPAVIAGLDIFDRVMHRFSKKIRIERTVAEGTYIDSVEATPPQLLTLDGPAKEMLSGERLALNLLQRMSGVATMTRQFVEKAKPYGIAILDTRKTTPCLRAFEKYAVKSAGGVNHRMGLFDNILIKENHIRSAGSITKAVQAVRPKWPGKSIEVEVTNLDEVKEALSLTVETLLLDNMTPEMVQSSISLVDTRAKIEVSGGINLSNIDRYLIKGIDYISIGAVTHSAKAIDMSLLITALK